MKLLFHLQATSWSEPEPGTERMPRISVDDFLGLLDTPEKVIVVDLRNNIQ